MSAAETGDQALIEVVSIKFKNRGKCYYFAPNGLQINTGDRVIVETAKGMEIADCVRGNHMVEDTAVVPPLRPVARVATADDLRIAELNKRREKEAFGICQQKIAEHGLDMKLVDVECNFEGNKTMFFFTSDGRVDFRELVKDLAGIFRNRIELRQIGVRDEAKMLGGIGICGRPYCCNQFLDDFQPVSTKMAKIQSLSLNPAKISGSCGRLMCCLRYEQEAYEELIKKVPKQGAFVETKDGYGTAVQVNLLRQTVKVKLDNDNDDTLKLFKANELAAVPGGRPKDGEPYPSVLHYVPEPEEEEEEEKADEWSVPILVTPEPVKPEALSDESGQTAKKRRRRRGGRDHKPKHENGEKTEQQPKVEEKPAHTREKAKGEQAAKKSETEGKSRSSRNRKSGENRGKAMVKPVKVEAKTVEAKSGENAKPKSTETVRPEGESSGNRRRRHHRKPKPKPKAE